MKNENNYLPEEIAKCFKNPKEGITYMRYQEPVDELKDVHKEKPLISSIVYLQIVIICMASGLTSYFTWYLLPLHVFLAYLSFTILSSIKKEKIKYESEIKQLRDNIQLDEYYRVPDKSLLANDIKEMQEQLKNVYRKKLSPEQRSKVHRKAALKRWANHKMNKKGKI